MSEKIYFAKVKELAIIPSKRDEDGCFDIYACIEDSITIKPHEVKLIPTGICSAFSSDYRISLRERGSNTKSKLIVMAGQIDSGFRGEWFVALYNASDEKKILTNHLEGLQEEVSTKKAICQAAIEYSPKVNVEEVSIDVINSFKSERGSGMLGSSGK